MKDKTRKLGLDVLSEAPWGTHLCHFYDTKEDLIDTLVPYFKAGLENNEFCMWVTAKPLEVDDAKASLGEAVENLDEYIEKGQIEILDDSQWYTRSGQFNADEALQGWVEKLDQALHRGFDGLRLAGNTFWLEERDWDDFAEYEAAVDNVISKYRTLVICSYSLGKCGQYEIIDVVKNHEFAIIRRHGTWEVFESAGRRRIKKKLHKKQELLDIILNSVPAMIWSKNAKGKYLSVNRAYCELVGLSKEKTLGKTDYDLYPTDLAAHYSEYDRKVIDSEQPVSGIEESHLKPSGDYGWSLTEKLPYYDHKGNVVGTIGFALDITERKQVEEELRKSQQFNKRLIDSSKDCIKVLDLQGRMLFMSRGGQELMEIENITPFLNTPWVDFWKGDDKKAASKAFSKAIQEGKGHFRGYCPTSKGTPKCWDVIITPIVSADDKIESFLTISRDITERKRLEAQVIQSAKMASLGIMAEGIAHEIRNPLAVCSSAAQLIIQNPNDRALREECADKIYSNIHCASHIIENLLKFARAPEDDFWPVNLKDALELCLSLIDHQIELQQIELNRELAKDLPRVMGNVNLLQQVFLALILNACNAMPKGGKLTVSTLANSDGDVDVRFVDTGCGIPEENLDKIFDPFFTTMPAGKGVGLGLSISYEIIQQHGGSIEVESRVDVGST
ncbi:MAG: MEDS domain-containing protein, partial [Chloroflexota bacterium]